MNSPCISVIMPVYNGGDYLKLAIESILSQSFENFELVIINDGSTDKSGDVIKSYSDLRIKSITNQSNLGLVCSLNLGIEHAKGKYIARMDADDISHPDRLRIQFEFLENNTSYGMCGTFYQIIDSQGNLQHKVELPRSDRDIKTFLNFGNCFCHSTVMFRKDLSIKNKYDKYFFLSEDYKLWYEFSKICKLAILPDYCVLYRFHSTNISSTQKQKTQLILKEMNGIILRDLKVSFTEAELDIHSNFLVFNCEYFKNRNKLADLEKWLVKAVTHLRAIPEFNPKVTARIFLRRWFVICIKTGNLNKIMFTSLLLQFRWRYPKIFVLKIKDSYLKKNLGIDY